MSSLAKLVQLGILDPDFLKLYTDASEEGSGSGSGSEPQPDPTPNHRRGPERRPLDRAELSSEPTVEYVTRPDSDLDSDSDSAQTQVPNDLEYYQNVGYHWLYSSPTYGWWHFAKDDNEKLEQMYRNGQKRGTIQIGHNSFTIDFEHMMQQGAGKPRHILRSPTLGDLLLKGVAGSRISKRDILADSVDQSHFGVPLSSGLDSDSDSDSDSSASTIDTDE